MNEFLVLFTRASKLLRASVDEAMSPHGVRVGQNLVLAELAETEGLTPGELAGRLRLATPTVVKSAARMEAAGLLTKRRDPADARLVRLHLTERGRTVSGPVEEARRRVARRATAALTDEERRHLNSALAKIIAALEEPAATGSPERADIGDNDRGAAAPHPPIPHNSR